jgi:hypothetical protein
MFEDSLARPAEGKAADGVAVAVSGSGSDAENESRHNDSENGATPRDEVNPAHGRAL